MIWPIGKKAEDSIKRIIDLLSYLSQFFTEIKNSIGSGCGEENDLLGLELKNTQLVTAVTSRVV